MNKAITDGVVFMPSAFADGLDVWSSGDGTPGSDTYDGAANAAFVPADQDFAGCLELQKINSVQKLRYMGETPLLPGTYLRITARVKAISGNLPSVRIAGWAGAAGGGHVGGLTEVGPNVALTQYGEVVEVSAIVGPGMRGGVDMVWGRVPIFGHFGLDLTGATGGVVRIDDIVIEDITGVFLRDMMGWVDVVDYGAAGDGVTDDLAAFEAADADAAGRRVMVPLGTYFLGDSMTFENEVQFEGTVTMPDAAIFVLAKNYDLPAYIDAFGNEELAFRKAFQALLNGAGHDSLDMGGRRVDVTGPIDLQAAVPNRTTYATRRVIRNGQFEAKGDSVWDNDVVTSQATYSVNDSKKLTGVVNIANIAVGFSSGIPVGGSLSGTTLIQSVGGQSRWANLFTGIFGAVLVLLFAPQLERLPMPALAGLLIMVGVSMINVPRIRIVRNTGPVPLGVMLTTLTATLFLPIQYAVAVGVILHVVLYVYQSAETVRIERIVLQPDGTFAESTPPDVLVDDDIVILQPVGSLFFAGAAEFEEHLPDVGDATGAVVMITLRDRDEVGSTFIRILGRYANELHAHDNLLMLVGVDERVLLQLERTELLDLIGRENVFMAEATYGAALHQALDAAEEWQEARRP